MKKAKLVSALVAIALGAFVGSAYPADEGTSVKSHDPAVKDVTGRSAHPDASEGSKVKSHDPAVNEVTGRSVHPDASEGSEVKSRVRKHTRRN